MPTLTEKLGIPIPAGNESASRQNSLVAPLQAIDEAAASQAQVDQPFYLKSAVAGAGGIVCTMGPGIANFLGTLVATTADSTYTVPNPAANTTYTVFVKSDGAFTHNATGLAIAGAVPIWRIAVGATTASLTITDLRGQLPGAAARMVQDALDTHMDGTQQHGAGSGRYLATTNRADQRAAYADLVGVPSTFAPAAHKTSHATGGSDALTPADIGAAPATRQIGTNGGLTGGGDLSADRTLSIADGGVTDTKIGNRTISDAAAPTGDTGTIATLLGWLANMIKSITGKANWRTAPATSLEAAANHINSTQGAHAGTAISNVPAGNISANSVQAAINELDTEKAGKDLANTFTQRQTFAAGTQDGDGNQDVSYLMSLQVPIDTRSWVFTAWSPAGRPTHGEIRDGTTVVCTIDITYDASSGNPTQAVFVAGGKTITCTIGWDAQGRCTGWNRAVS